MTWVTGKSLKKGVGDVHRRTLHKRGTRMRSIRQAWLKSKTGLSIICSIAMTLTQTNSGMCQLNLEMGKHTTNASRPMRTGQLPYGASAVITLNVPLEVAWKSLMEFRTKQPEKLTQRVIQKTDKYTILEEKFELATILGTVKCTLNSTEIPLQRVDYRLTESQQIKAMEGSWILTPSSDGKSTTVKITSYLDIGIPLPRILVNCIVKHKLQNRLRGVKEIAEAFANNTKPPIVERLFKAPQKT
jgi:hypothetical protein